MKRTKELILIGSGGHARKLISVIEENNLILLGFLSSDKKGKLIEDYTVLGYLELLNDSIFDGIPFHIAIGENYLRYEILSQINNNQNLRSLISKSCNIKRNVNINNGTYIGENVIIQNDVKIGKCCLIDSGVILEHDVNIGEFVNVSPSAVLCGNVNLQNGVIIGAGAIIIEGITIGENSLIGAGSIVINDIEPNSIAVGNPAKIIKNRDFSEPYLQ